jgi:hypothetical protein
VLTQGGVDLPGPGTPADGDQSARRIHLDTVEAAQVEHHAADNTATGRTSRKRSLNGLQPASNSLSPGRSNGPSARPLSRSQSVMPAPACSGVDAFDSTW